MGKALVYRFGFLNGCGKAAMALRLAAVLFLSFSSAQSAGQDYPSREREVPAAPAVKSKSPLPDKTAFALAMELGNVSAAKEWLQAGLDPEFEGDRIGTGLMIAAWEGNVALMDVFVKAGADVNKENKAGEQALLHAAWKGKREAVEWLLARGARINRGQGVKKWSALAYAVFAGHAEVAKGLMDKGADINALSTNGSSVLMMAAREGREDLAKELLRRGASTAAVNEWGDNALSWAMRHNNLDIARMVSGEDGFKVAVSKPKESWGKPVSSMPVPEEVEVLMRESRIAGSEGRKVDESALHDRIASALARLSAEKPMAARLSPSVSIVTGVEIRASRKNPFDQSVNVLFESGYGVDPFNANNAADTASRKAKKR